ncbi:hypothetical protein EV702DRAFT_1051142 [Suillus placidus]|uniref:Uncharacterized protein n=1 Tax=Suillus placidus TaxID=48579 RepID=A0A9P7CVV3_9AGAM|nr:hypothetical protein EV702DRAFT_1051142 [Suillus placidus]
MPLERYNQLAPLQMPPGEVLKFSEVASYAWLGEFELLKHSWQEVLTKPWVSKANRKVAGKYFKIICAREEIDHLNIEIARLQKWVDDEDAHLFRTATSLSMSNPALASEVHRLHDKHQQVNNANANNGACCNIELTDSAVIDNLQNTTPIEVDEDDMLCDEAARLELFELVKWKSIVVTLEAQFIFQKHTVQLDTSSVPARILPGNGLDQPAVLITSSKVAGLQRYSNNWIAQLSFKLWTCWRKFLPLGSQRGFMKQASVTPSRSHGANTVSCGANTVSRGANTLSRSWGLNTGSGSRRGINTNSPSRGINTGSSSRARPVVNTHQQPMLNTPCSSPFARSLSSAASGTTNTKYNFDSDSMYVSDSSDSDISGTGAEVTSVWAQNQWWPLDSICSTAMLDVPPLALINMVKLIAPLIISATLPPAWAVAILVPLDQP